VALLKTILSGCIDLEAETYNCEICKQRGYFKNRNCNGEDEPVVKIYDENVRFVIDKDLVLNYCPKILMFDEDVIELIQIYGYFKKNIPYCSGGFVNQPWHIVEAMLLFQQIEYQIENNKWQNKNKFK